jgi:hypothetical protein
MKVCSDTAEFGITAKHEQQAIGTEIAFTFCVGNCSRSIGFFAPNRKENEGDVSSRLFRFITARYQSIEAEQKDEKRWSIST